MHLKILKEKDELPWYKLIFLVGYFLIFMNLSAFWALMDSLINIFK